MLRSVFGPWILENTWGVLFLVMRRCYSENLVGGFESKLRIWVNQSWGDFVFLRRTDESQTVRLLNAGGPPWWFMNHGRSAFRSADGPPVSDFSDAC